MLKSRMVLMSDNQTASEVITELARLGFRLGYFVEETLLQNLKPSSGIYELGIIRKDDLPDTRETTVLNFDKEANCRGWTYATAESAVLSRKEVSDKDLQEAGLSVLIVRHKPVEIHGRLSCLSICTFDGGNLLSLHATIPGSYYPGTFAVAYQISVS